ncbi:MAG: hypothetical protein ACREQ5_37060, partial [Candidatus Dormibacteria bacterium]
MVLQRTSASSIRAAHVLELMARGVSGRYRITGDTDAAQCVVALDFGYRLVQSGILEPGPCNEYFASLALATSNGRPIVSQAEVDQAIRSVRGGMGADHVIRSARNPERYLDTREFAVQVHSIMDGYGWTSAALIAHPHHLPRAQAVVSSRGIEVATPAGVRSIWDRESNQPWTRNPIR